jgi:hypothetical protein
MEQIQNLLNNYNDLAQKYSHEKSIKALKKQYSDICSNGDVIINDLINILNKDVNNNNATNKMIEYRNMYTKQDYFDNVVINLLETIDDFYKDGLNPNPFWAN